MVSHEKSATKKNEYHLLRTLSFEAFDVAGGEQCAHLGDGDLVEFGSRSDLGRPWLMRTE